mmetsp:Transcript_34426/g.75356  ORF Transcript_34426/g.75356 Transcript_34426/m.75356 type:complete len:259 (-) Transcript_34426:1389-2165(-)
MEFRSPAGDLVPRYYLKPEQEMSLVEDMSPLRDTQGGGCSVRIIDAAARDIEDSDWIGKVPLRAVISWTRDGTAFEIHDMKLFKERVLPTQLLGKHKNMTSCSKQLNIWYMEPIKKDSKTNANIAWQNENFLRGGKHLLERLRRRPEKRKDTPESSAPGTATGRMMRDSTDPSSSQHEVAPQDGTNDDTTAPSTSEDGIEGVPPTAGCSEVQVPGEVNFTWTKEEDSSTLSLLNEDDSFDSISSSCDHSLAPSPQFWW